MDKDRILQEIKDILVKNKLPLLTAESCTGGLISSYLTDISGASEFIFSNFVTYSNDAKMKYLSVQKSTLEKYGAVSEQTAKEMSQGLLKLSNNQGCSIATTGILGPTGGSKEKPVGLVYISLGYKEEIEVIRYISKQAQTKNRYLIKEDIAKHALVEFKNFIEKRVNND